MTATAATAARVLAQLRNDRRTVVMLLVVPCLLLVLFRYVFDGSPAVFDRVGLPLLGIFGFVTMFLVASIAMVRERIGGTLERLLSTPLPRASLLGGYGTAFGLVATLQAGLATATALWPLGMRVAAGPGLIVLLAVLNALLGMAIGLFLSAFATSEFQAVQFMPAAVLPQFLLCGLIAPRDQMADVLRWISNVLPMSYSVDALQRAQTSDEWSAALVTDIAVIAGCIVVALGLGAATLRRRTP